MFSPLPRPTSASRSGPWSRQSTAGSGWLTPRPGATRPSRSGSKSGPRPCSRVLAGAEGGGGQAWPRPVLPPKFHLKQAVAPPSHLAQVSPPPAGLRAGRAGVPLPASQPASGEGTSGTGPLGTTPEDSSGWRRPRRPRPGGPGPACRPPCKTATSCCRPCSPRPACAPWRCPQTCSWTAGVQRGRRPSGCAPPGSRSRSALASCSWASSRGTTGRPSRTGPPEVGSSQQGGLRAAGVAAAGGGGLGGRGGARPEASVRPAPGFSALTHRGPALSHPPRPGGRGRSHGWGFPPPLRARGSPRPGLAGPSRPSCLNPPGAGGVVGTWHMAGSSPGTHLQHT